MYMRIRTETADTVITTPAGAFRCAKYVHEWFTREGNPISSFISEYVWFAPRVGIVQTESWYTPYGTNVPELSHMHRLIRISR